MKNNAPKPQLKNKNTNMINIIETLEVRATEFGEICVVTRHNQEAKNDFLRWQVGTYESRPMEDPIYAHNPDGTPVLNPDGTHKLHGHEVNPAVCCKVFRLLGFGSNLRQANYRASLKLPKATL